MLLDELCLVPLAGQQDLPHVDLASDIRGLLVGDIENILHNPLPLLRDYLLSA